MKKHTALIIDDEPDILELLQLTLQRIGVDCVPANSLNEAQAQLEKRAFSLCLTDMRLPDGDGLTLVAHCRQHHPKMPIAVLTAHGNMETAIQALKHGAFDFLSKPVDVQHLRNTVRHALTLDRTRRGKQTRGDTGLLIGNSLAIQELRSTITKVARSQAPVLILGESGVGKELVAQIIHANSSRKANSFVPVNCAAIPKELVESEFFGHVKGSFTGAIANSPGLFKAADGSTLFLDEIGELPQFMQVKLLRALQENSVRAVGSDRETYVDVRLISATHQNLQSAVQNGRFRHDFYYRINVINLEVPPLRNRRDDIPLLVEHALRSIAHEEHLDAPPHVTQATMRALQEYDYPGNVRELVNMLERAVALSRDATLQPEHLGIGEPDTAIQQPDALIPVDDKAMDTGAGTEEKPLDEMLQTVERQQILKTLERMRWNRTAAAKKLGISLRSLRYRMRKLGLDN